MKDVIYVTNGEVPYRTLFFNKFAEKCNLKVIYEYNHSLNRNKEWCGSIDKRFVYEYLSDNNSSKFSLNQLKILKLLYEEKTIIFGCVNTPTQILAILLFKLFRKKYLLNLDGECFIEQKTLKTKIKKFILNGAYGYLVAGEQSANSLKKYLEAKNIITYYFSSLTNEQLIENKRNYENNNEEEFVLIVGQYEAYKGLDIALEVAEKMPEIQFKFIGMNKKQDVFNELVKRLNVHNVETVEFLQYKDLISEYRKCKALVLPSRQECWGLVINEAASCGTPLVSTYGAGAAVEFLKGRYDCFLAEPDNAQDLSEKIMYLLKYDKLDEYKKYLVDISTKYSIEENVRWHMGIFVDESMNG